MIRLAERDNSEIDGILIPMAAPKQSSPSIDEQIEVIRGTIESLSRSHTDYFGPNEGAIADPEAVRCIECLKATLAILRSHQAPSR